MTEIFLGNRPDESLGRHERVPYEGRCLEGSTDSMMDHASQTQVRYDTGWKKFEMTAGVRLSAHSASDEEPSGEQTAIGGVGIHAWHRSPPESRAGALQGQGGN